jgi:signal transduction histidine kinase
LFNHPRLESKGYLSRRFWILGVLFLALCVLALVQYRWVTQLAQAESRQAGANLSATLGDMESDFDIEVTRAFLVFQLPAARMQTEAQLYREWILHAPYPRLIRGVYVAEVGVFDSPPQAVLPGEPAITMAEWKRAAGNLAMPFTGAVVASGAFGTRMDFRIPSQEHGIVVSVAQPNLEVEIGGNPAFVLPMMPTVPTVASGGVGRGPGAVLRMQGTATANVRADLGPSRFAVVVLDEKYLRETLLPAFVERYFPASEYQVEVVGASGHLGQNAIFSSKSVHSSAPFGKPDGSIAIFRVRPDCFPLPSGEGFRAARTGAAGYMTSAVDVSQILSLRPSACVNPAGSGNRSDGGMWMVNVKFRAGSLGAAIADLRDRNLLLGGGVLLVLALGIVMLVVLTERTRSLAEMQTDFVLGVSHELRTPLTVIRLAAENLKRGLVENSAQARQYGEIVQAHAEGLSSMIENTLALARIQSGATPPQPTPSCPGVIVKAALKDTEPLAREAGMDIELDLAQDLPPVRGDADSITRCVENLIRNAIKYAASGGCIAIRAKQVRRAAGERVEIAVEDRGPGISLEDLPHIFEPFYRGGRKEGIQVPGVGLGLTLVKRVIEAHQGTVEISTAEGAGTRIAILLPSQRSREERRTEPRP